MSGCIQVVLELKRFQIIFFRMTAFVRVQAPLVQSSEFSLPEHLNTTLSNTTCKPAVNPVASASCGRKLFLTVTFVRYKADSG